jgi:hypothetical protein
MTGMRTAENNVFFTILQFACVAAPLEADANRQPEDSEKARRILQPRFAIQV